MFWTIAGLLSGAALHFATLMQKSSRTQRARWMGMWARGVVPGRQPQGSDRRGPEEFLVDGGSLSDGISDNLWYMDVSCDPSHLNWNQHEA